MMRLIWIAFLASLALVATFAQLDRQSRRDKELAQYVPAPFRGFAQRHVAASALARNDSAAALAEARQLVLRRPIPAENLLMLSAARQSSGEELAALQTLQIAALRGWRLQPAQEMMLQLALLNGDPQEAANRLAALWALGAESPAKSEFAQAVLSSEAGRQAFAAQLAGTQRWQDRFLNEGLQVADPDLLAQTIHDAVRQGADFDCKAMSRVAHQLANAGNAAATGLIWTGPCAAAADSGRQSIAFDPDHGEQAAPFAWQYLLQPRIALDVRELGGNRVVDYESREPVIKVLAIRLARLPAGSHALALSSQTGSGYLAMQVHCIDTAGNRRKIAGRIGEGGLEFTVPASTCPVQRIEIMARSGSREALRINLK